VEVEGSTPSWATHGLICYDVAYWIRKQAQPETAVKARTCLYSSADRVPHYECGGRGFESLWGHVDWRNMTQHEKAEKSILGTIETVQDNIPDGREKQLAITKLEEALLWINATVTKHTARNR
jgi:hypothetical protein